MSTLSPSSPANITTLTAIRLRLLNLSRALQTLDHAIRTGNPLHPYPILYDSFNHITRELVKLTDLIRDHQGFLESVHVYPLPSFPGVEYEALIAQLLRRKLEGGVEAWFGGAVGGVRERERAVEGNGGVKLSGQERRQLWKEAGKTAEKVLGEMPRGLDYTLEELVNGIEEVETGIRRELRMGDEKPVVEDVDEEEEVPAMALEDVMRFMTKGETGAAGGYR